MRLFLLGCVVLGSVIWSGAVEKPRIYITDSKSWEISGGVAGGANGVGGAASGGDRPQTAEIIKTFNQRCPMVMVNNNREKADYVVLLDHEGGKGPIGRDNKVVVFNKDGDSIMSGSTRSLGNAVQNACSAIATDWPKQANKMADTSKPEAASPEVAGKKN